MTIKSTTFLTDHRPFARRERMALAKILAKRRSGVFVSGGELDSWLVRMLDEKRQARGRQAPHT